MAFKDDIEAMCIRAVRDKEDVIVRLPTAPKSWTQHKIEERFFQLVELLKRNKCTITKVNITDYKIHALPDE